MGGTLRVCASLDYSTYRLPQVLAAYMTQFPNVKLQVSSEHSRDCVRILQEGKIHAAVVRGNYDWSEGKILLEQEPVCLITQPYNR